MFTRFRSRQGLGVVTDVAVAAFVVGMLGLMILLPGDEAGPYHVMFLALAIAYAYRSWPLVPTITATVVIAALSGWLMVSHASKGWVATAELAEIPLLPLVLLVMVWHVRRRRATVEEMERMTARQLEAVDRERDFFRDASHALRTPVTIARGHLELMAAGELDDDLRSDLSVAMVQLDRMSSLSQRLLALARLDSGRGLRPQPTDLGELVHEVAGNWSDGSGREWRIDSEPTGTIMADPEWVAMILDALLENAVHFTPADGVITVRCRRSGNRCTVTVADSGPGIEPADLPQVFERFWHRKPPYGPMGTGLGLPMARSAAIAHGGTLSVRNGPDGGAEFEMVLPADGRPSV